MAIKEITAFINHSTEDFGLSSTDTKAHVPQFFMLRKWPVDESADSSRHFHPYSSEASLAAAVELEDKDMERWTSSSAEEGMAAEATPENGEGAGEERPLWHGFSDEEEDVDQSDPDQRPWCLRNPIPTPPEEEAQNAEEVALAAEQQQQSQEADGRGPGLSSGPQDEHDGPVEHRLPAFHGLRRLRARSSDSDSNTLELVDRSSGDESSMSSGILEQYEAYQREHGKGKGQGTLSFTVTEVPRTDAEERGPGLPSGPQDEGGEDSKGKGKAEGRGPVLPPDTWNRSLPSGSQNDGKGDGRGRNEGGGGTAKGRDQNRDQGKGRQLPPWWQSWQVDPNTGLWHWHQDPYWHADTNWHWHADPNWQADREPQAYRYHTRHRGWR